jgi:hypothetical protein
MYAPPKPSDPLASPTTLTEYDCFLFGTNPTILLQRALYYLMLMCDRHPHALRQFPRTMENILGRYRTIVDETSSRWENVWHVCVDGESWWWTRVDRVSILECCHSSRDGVYPDWISDS